MTRLVCATTVRPSLCRAGSFARVQGRLVRGERHEDPGLWADGLSAERALRHVRWPRPDRIHRQSGSFPPRDIPALSNRRPEQLFSGCVKRRARKGRSHAVLSLETTDEGKYIAVLASYVFNEIELT